MSCACLVAGRGQRRAVWRAVWQKLQRQVSCCQAACVWTCHGIGAKCTVVALPIRLQANVVVLRPIAQRRESLVLEAATAVRIWAQSDRRCRQASKGNRRGAPLQPG